MRTRIVAEIMWVGFWLAAPGFAGHRNASQATAEQVQVIEVTARKYEFLPSEIRVKPGTKVQLRVRALDRKHGIQFQLFPEGSEASAPPGLRFDPPQKKWNLEKDHVQVIEFLAHRPGTYPFKCSKLCGPGHKGMKGRVVVEE